MEDEGIFYSNAKNVTGQNVLTTASKEFLWMKKRVLVPGLIKAELLAFRRKLGGRGGELLTPLAGQHRQKATMPFSRREEK